MNPDPAEGSGVGLGQELGARVRRLGLLEKIDQVVSGRLDSRKRFEADPLALALLKKFELVGVVDRLGV